MTTRSFRTKASSCLFGFLRKSGPNRTAVGTRTSALPLLETEIANVVVVPGTKTFWLLVTPTRTPAAMAMAVFSLSVIAEILGSVSMFEGHANEWFFHDD